MKIFLHLFIFLFGIAGNSEVMASISFKVMTYNIRLDSAGDSLDNWQHRKSDMIRFIQAQNPDFIGVQEALFHQMQFLDEDLKNYKYIGVGRADGATGDEFSAIFYKTDSWTVIEDSTFWLSKTPAVPSKGWDADFPRICTFGQFKHKSGAVISLFNTHFDHVGKKARRKSVKLIKSALETRAKNHPVLLIGDFNVVPSNTVYVKITAFMTDSRTGASEIHEESVGTFNGFKPKGPFERRIDYVFVKNENITVKKYQVEMPLTQSGRQLSDHFPVIVEIEIEQE